MKALSVPQPLAEALVRGLKTIDVRTKPTEIRGRVYVYANHRRFNHGEEVEMLVSYGIGDVNSDDLPRGVLIGTTELWDCTGGGGIYQWHFRNPERATELLKPTTRPHSNWFEPF